MKGDFPPSSKVTGLRLLFAANPSTILPVPVDPVKASCKGINGFRSKPMINYLQTTYILLFILWQAEPSISGLSDIISNPALNYTWKDIK